MEETLNPFAPGAGTPPPELAGRSDILKSAEVSLARIAAVRPAKGLILIGLRGVGKTVLLNEVQKIAENTNYEAVFVEAHEGKRLGDLLVPELRRVLLKMDRVGAASEVAKKALRVLRSFISSVKIKYEGLELDVKPEPGVADTGDLESDLTQLFVALGEAAKARKRPVALIIDELQYLDEAELSALIMAVHRVTQKQLPVILVGAGLPQLVGQMGRSKSYAERLFEFPPIGPLSTPDAKKALQDPAKAEGAEFNAQALSEIIKVTEGYPYFLQEWGYHSWNISEKSPIDLNTVRKAHKKAIDRLDKSFFRVRFDRLTNREKDYLRAMAELGPGPHRSGDIAEALGVKVETVAPVRNNLIRKGMIYSQQHGETSFTVPLFDQYMKRVMPKMPKRRGG
ncbi:MAG: ATP-binding protein [Hyphomicrobiales bacterium]|nr:MAG: ATP-binding protein [Hyphomicrobiales bacterium]